MVVPYGRQGMHDRPENMIDQGGGQNDERPPEEQNYQRWPMIGEQANTPVGERTPDRGHAGLTEQERLGQVLRHAATTYTKVQPPSDRAQQPIGLAGCG